MHNSLFFYVTFLMHNNLNSDANHIFSSFTTSIGPFGGYSLSSGLGLTVLLLLSPVNPPPLHHHIHWAPLSRLGVNDLDGAYAQRDRRVGPFLIAVWLCQCIVAYELFNNRRVYSPLKH